MIDVIPATTKKRAFDESNSSSSSASVVPTTSTSRATARRGGGGGSSSSSKGRIKLLLQCDNGCVPYLNPAQLEQYFPPTPAVGAVGADLWLGLAVRDSCVVPIFSTTTENTWRTERGHGRGKTTTTKTDNHNDQHRTGGSGAIINKKSTTQTKTATSSSTSSRVRGYTFAATKPDPWITAYTRVSVPSFHLTKMNNGNDDDADAGSNNSKKKKGRGRGRSSGNTSKNTNTEVFVYTQHGRQKLTPELYANAALNGLQSHHTVALFDDIDRNTTNNNNKTASATTKKRKEKAECRNEIWFQHLCDKKTDNDSSSASQVWKPILLPISHNGDDGDDDNDVTSTIPLPLPSPSSNKPAVLSSSLSRDTQNSSDDQKKKEQQKISGIAFIGPWKKGMVLSQNRQYASVKWKAILTTDSLHDIVDILNEGTINVIGTNLPQTWAKQKVAMGSIHDILLLLTSTSTSSDVSITTTTTTTTREGKKRPKQTTITDTGCGCMALSDRKYALDSHPLVLGCGCFACKDGRFSRAYVHHLICAKELLAEIILFGHNLHSLLHLLRTYNDQTSRMDSK